MANLRRLADGPDQQGVGTEDAGGDLPEASGPEDAVPEPPPPDVSLRPVGDDMAAPKAYDRSAESGRERSTLGTGGRPPETIAAPSRPTEPTPMAGAASLALDASSGVLPRQDPVSPATLRAPSATLFGTRGGLTGGGLGVPQDPTTRAANDPIDGLIQWLQQRQQRP